MKKLFVMTLAVAALASCSKVEPIEPGYKSAIGFSKSFVDNSTKAVLTTGTITNFSVWGTENGTPIFTGDEVRKGDDTQGSTWGYTGTRYWHENSDYSFAAVAPHAYVGGTVSATSGLPTTATYTLATTLAEQVDLLYATATVAGTNVVENYNTPVEFSFEHQLAKVKFAIKNDYPAGYTVEISNLVINASKTATVTFDGTTWGSHDGDVELSFAIATIESKNTGESGESLIIPKAAWANAGDIFYTIDGTATVKKGSTVVKTIDLDYELKNELEAGFHYDITATIASNAPIVFSATVKDFDDTTKPDIVFP